MDQVADHGISRLERSETSPLDPLTEFSIRLIAIDTALSDDLLYCKTKRFERKSCPPYIALSYVWGPSNETVMINLDGRNTTIGRNLHNVLLQFRDWQSSCAFHETLGLSPELGDSVKMWIWADAISINQRDGVEKSHQISRMDEIYTSAALVLCWLGLPAEENVEHLQELMQAANELGYVL